MAEKHLIDRSQKEMKVMIDERLESYFCGEKYQVGASVYLHRVLLQLSLIRT